MPRNAATSASNVSRGFTLVELIACVSVLSILTAIAAPSMAALMERQRAVAATNALVTQLAMARMAAISKRGISVLCPSHNGANCDAGSDCFIDSALIDDADLQPQAFGTYRNGFICYRFHLLRLAEYVDQIDLHTLLCQRRCSQRQRGVAMLAQDLRTGRSRIDGNDAIAVAL